MNRDDFATWLNGFCTGWENNDVDKLMDLFTEHIEYWESPYEATYVGAPDVRRSFLKDPEHQIDRHMDAEILGVSEESGVACWRASYRHPETRVLKDNNGVMLVRFSTNGRCHGMYQWQVIRDHPE